MSSSEPSRPSTIPEEWLLCPTTVAEVEERLAEKWPLPEIWLKQWRAIVDRMGSDDELWEYRSSGDGPDDDIDDDRSGYALLHDGEVIEFIGLPPGW